MAAGPTKHRNPRKHGCEQSNEEDSRYLQEKVTSLQVKSILCANLLRIKLIPKNLLNPYPGNWEVKRPPVHFCLCISKTVRDTAMRFCDIVLDSDGYLSHINLSHRCQKCKHGGLEIGSTF